MSNYNDLLEINRLQQDIMWFVDGWARREKTPISLKEIITHMQGEGVKSFTTVNAINSLLRKGYIRRAVTISNKTFYVQTKRI